MQKMSFHKEESKPCYFTTLDLKYASSQLFHNSKSPIILTSIF